MSKLTKPMLDVLVQIADLIASRDGDAYAVGRVARDGTLDRIVSAGCLDWHKANVDDDDDWTGWRLTATGADMVATRRAEVETQRAKRNKASRGRNAAMASCGMRRTASGWE